MASENGKFKVGDRVRLNDDNFGYGEKGDIGIVEGFDNLSVRVGFETGKQAGDYWWASHDKLELVPAWQPKVGDRVRYSDKHVSGVGVVIEKISAGELEWMVRVEDKDLDRAYYHGNTCRAFQTSSLSPVEVRAATPAPATLTIESGKFYKTRDGRKVGPMERFDAESWCVNQSGNLWADNGERYFNYDKGGPTDLVALWEEPASNENAVVAKPKFKVGDRVVTVDNKNDLGTITRAENGLFAISWDERPSARQLLHWTEPEMSFATTTPTTPAIVALIENGTPRPSTAPKVHTSQEAATTEAERLALEHPGQKFGVFVLADSKIADLVTTQTAVLRAA